MSGTFNPAAIDAKLDRISGQLTTITNRLNSHDARLARPEKVKAGSNDGGVSDLDSRRVPNGGDDESRGGGEDFRDSGEDPDGRA